MSIPDPATIRMKQFRGVMIILLIVTFFASYNVILYSEEQKRTAESDAVHDTPLLPSFTIAEVAEHNSATSCWMAAFGNVYDLTEYVTSGSHPGGQQALLSGCGTEATATFERIHSPSARRDLEALKIGILSTE